MHYLTALGRLEGGLKAQGSGQAVPLCLGPTALGFIEHGHVRGIVQTVAAFETVLDFGTSALGAWPHRRAEMPANIAATLSALVENVKRRLMVTPSLKPIHSEHPVSLSIHRKFDATKGRAVAA